MDEESEYGQHEDDLESFEQEQVFHDREHDDPMSDQLETEHDEDWLGRGDPGREDFHSDG